MDLYLLIVDVTAHSHSGHPTWGSTAREDASQLLEKMKLAPGVDNLSFTQP